MRPNVFITARERGKVVARREGHNVWVDDGRSYLASLLAYSSLGPDTPEINKRPKFMGMGIGGVGQSNSGVADAAPFSTAYPSGDDPNSTNGHAYNDEFPVSPLIGTLERPVRISGGTNPYPGDLGDEWIRAMDAIVRNAGSTTIHFFCFFPAGSFAYGPYTPIVPLSEIGLFDSEKDTTGRAFQAILAYRTFDTINLNADTSLEIEWQVLF